MEVEDQSLEEKCECLMNIVVETRKQYGKMCVDYGQKKTFVENKLLKLQLKTYGNHRFKTKNHFSEINVEEMTKDIDEFREEIGTRQKRLQGIKQNVIDIQRVVLQLKDDVTGQRIRRQLTAENLLAAAKKRYNK